MNKILFLMSWPFRQLPLPLSLFLAINTLTVAGFYFAYRNMERTYDSFKIREEENQQSLVNRLAHEVDLEMNHTFQVFENFTSSISNALQLLGFESAYRNFTHRGTITQFMKRNPNVVSLVIRDILGRQYIENGQSDLQAADFADYLEKAAAESLNGHSYRSPILKAPQSATPVVMFSEPVRDSGGTLVASLTVIISLKPLVVDLLEFTPPNYQLFICDDTGRLIAHSRTAFRENAPSIFSPGSDFSNHPVVQFHIETKGRLSQVQSYHSLDQQPFIGCSAQSSFLPWMLGIEINRDIAFATVTTMKKSLHKWLIVTLIVSSLVALFLAHAIRMPLQQLLDGSMRVASQSFSEPIQLQSGNELGILARQFNKMQRSIQLYLDQIKEAALRQKETLLKAIYALVNAIDAKDPYTKGHSKRVSRFARFIALELGQTGTLLERTELSALLHDIGKIGIDDNILKKPAQLTAEEYEVMKTHPEKGFKILGAIEDLQPITDGLRYHHENWGGDGYPRGLRGEAIPLQARIVAVADAFDAMTTNRPYQMAMSWEDAINRLNELSGIRFDPKVVGAITHAFYSGKLCEEDF
ncbi:MAG: hypothetical protein CSA81_04115 [Acidobacteria bacterium]|nr:MAG: hypothetical protein CSA81_04115 [Acidobacteriota bacterium]